MSKRLQWLTVVCYWKTEYEPDYNVQCFTIMTWLVTHGSWYNAVICSLSSVIMANCQVGSKLQKNTASNGRISCRRVCFSHIQRKLILSDYIFTTIGDFMSKYDAWKSLMLWQYVQVTKVSKVLHHITQFTKNMDAYCAHHFNGKVRYIYLAIW